jgi:parallel beta-helix repeat protein
VAKTIAFDRSRGPQGFHLVSEKVAGIDIVYSMGSLRIEQMNINGETMDVVAIPGVFLPNDEGAPNLPGLGRYIALPQGAVAELEVVEARTQVLHDMNIAPAPPIPREDDDSPLVYTKDPTIYDKDEFYPREPIALSGPQKMRGVDVVILGITPFQYNPVSKDLVVYTDVRVKVSFVGGNGHFGNDRYRSRYWEPVLQANLVNYASLPQLDFSRRPLSKDNGYEYVIIVPDDPDFIAWADTIKHWRTLQGISTGLFTLTETGSSASEIESWIDNAYYNWAMDAVLLLSDYPGSGKTYGIPSPKWSDYCRSDNIYADVNGDDLPDLNIARITAQDAADLEVMVTKFLDYERNPYTDPDFYDHPVAAGGWQTERWFILCSEVIYGFWANVLGKDPVREYAIYSGTPGSIWSTNPNTDMVVDYFGPNGLGYVPATPEHLTDWASNATRLNNDINSHGNETGWGEPSYHNSDLDGLSNTMFPFVFSINCLTGKYDSDSECFTEKFHRIQHGALGLVAASNVSYSFVNDVFVFGIYDGMWPEFDPGYAPGDNMGSSNLRPAFAQASGKYYLEASSWPYNPEDKEVTYHLFHMHGDAFTTLYSEVPQALSVSHPSVLFMGLDYFPVTADDGSVIALTVDGEIIGVADGTGGTVYVPVQPQIVSGTMVVTVTKFNHYRYQQNVFVIPPEGPFVIYHSSEIDDSQGNNNGVVNPGETILMPITVRNIGIENAQNVSAILRTEDQWILVTDSTQSFGDIDSGMTAVSLGDYVFQTDAYCPDSHVVRFDLEATNGDTSWVTSFFQMVVEPNFVMTASPDTVVVPQGDSAYVTLTFTSLGGFNWQVDLSHTALPTGVTGFLDPNQLIPTDSSIFRLYGAPDASPGLHSVTITATGGGISREKEVVLGIVPPPYYGPVWHASPEGHDFIGNGSEEFPFRRIQKCIDCASIGDTVLAAAGLYTENIDFTGKIILVASHFILDGRESAIESTVIDGDRRGSVVTCSSGEDSNSVIRGFTLTGGYASYGGGVCCNNSSPTVADNFIVNNECVPGNGGPAIYCGHGSNATIRRNLIANCTGPAAVFLHIECDAQVINNTICNNSWGAMSIQGYSDPLIKNNIFYNNYYYGIHLADGSPVISYNDVYGSDDNYLGIDDQTGINGNISTDPLFLDPDTGDYHLTGNSPCVDAGDPADSVPPGGGTCIDMGAFEFVHGPYVSYHSHQIDDSAGNNNGVVNPGEVIAMPITIENNGNQTSYGVSGILRTDDDFVVVTDSIKDFGDIQPQMTAVSIGDYWFEVDSSCPNLHQVTFELELTDNGATWISFFTETVIDQNFVMTLVPPALAILPGDSGQVKVILTSVGGFGSEVSLSHSELPPGVTCVLDPDHLIPTDSSVLRLYTTLDVSMDSYPITVIASGGGITHEEAFELAIVGRGDVNRDGMIDASDVVYLIVYLYRGGPPPEPLELGDANADGYVNAADVVYLIQYLYRGGPPPPAKYGRPPGATLNQLPAQLWLASAGAAGTRGKQRILIRGTFGVDIAAVELAIEYDPQKSSLSPVLPGHLQDLQIFSIQKQGILKVGFLDLKGESWIAAGEGVDLLILNTKGTDLSSLWIKEAVLADRHGWMVPVKIVTKEEIERSRPESFSLYQNHPNPSNPQTQIRYALPADCYVKITLYNLLGRRVGVLVDKHQSAGYKTVHWDGKDERGDDVASGIYFYRIQAGEFMQTKKMLLLK